MREVININKNWLFSKKEQPVPKTLPEDWESVNLPHTWNGTDGQDGGNDYYRGKCCYVKLLKKADLGEKPVHYIQFDGVNSSAEVWWNGEKIGSHDGGYSAFRVRIPKISDENILTVYADNSPNDTVYPQVADFTFYGGIYRDVTVIGVDESHFDLEFYGSSGIMITPKVSGLSAAVNITARVTNPQDCSVRFVVTDADKKPVGEKSVDASDGKTVIEIENAHLWNGTQDPYLYSLTAELLKDGEKTDEISVRFGCRSFSIDPQKGFILNGKPCPLRGVSRHQDRPGIGNALTEKEHREDMDLICELGANTIRLAHYQHSRVFYDLCDERGMAVWAEIPYISRHMPGGRENTVSQMKELIYQNINHPSIIVWGLSNEITMNGASDSSLIENHRMLNDLVHKIDPTRPTTIAVLSMCDPGEEYVRIPDVLSYNHYFGWYGGDVSMYGDWFDTFHKKYPNKAIGMSEYGCEALNWHTSNPEQGDYTEEYQAYYHEELIKQLFTRDYIWATHVWNMYDFAADARAEGGENGMNHKGLVTFDRKYKKDAFYAYKAWLSDDPFVHICGKRYVDRVEDTTKVTVYSNQPEVELFVNGESLGKQTSDVHFFYFDVPNAGESTLVAKAGDCSDESKIRKVDTFNEEYRLKEEGEVLNWFDIDMPEGYFNINDKIGDIMKANEGKMFIDELMLKIMKGADGGAAEAAEAAAGAGSEGLMKMLSGFTVKRMLNLMGTAGGGKQFTKEELLELNSKLNKIKR